GQAAPRDQGRMDDGADRHTFDLLRCDAGGVPAGWRAFGRLVDRSVRSRLRRADDRARIQTANVEDSGRRDSPCAPGRAQSLNRGSRIEDRGSPYAMARSSILDFPRGRSCRGERPPERMKKGMEFKL